MNEKDIVRLSQKSNVNIISPDELSRALVESDDIGQTRRIKDAARKATDLYTRILPDSYELASQYALIYLKATAKAGRQLGPGKPGAPKGNRNAEKQIHHEVQLNSNRSEQKRRNTERKMAKCEDETIERYAHTASENREVPNISGCLSFIDIGGVQLSSGFYEWYTPPEYANAAREVMGNIDLDPASNEKANKLVKADRFYTAEDNGLEQPWAGNVYCNPPYSAPLVRSFTEKLINDYSSKNVKQGIFLVHHATDSEWWQMLVSAGALVAFPSGRINFIDGRTMKQNPGSSIRGQSIFYLGRQLDRFAKKFSQFGVVMRPYV